MPEINAPATVEPDYTGCAVDGCDRPHECRGWCNAHHQRWYKTGDVRAEVPIGGMGGWNRVPVGAISTDSDGYHLVKLAEDDPALEWVYAKNGCWALEHRVVMARLPQF